MEDCAAPYTPPGQLLQDADPAMLYVPGAQATAVGEVLPGGQEYPGLHSPAHEEDPMPAASPYKPAGQSVHTAEPWTLNRPTGQMDCK